MYEFYQSDKPSENLGAHTDLQYKAVDNVEKLSLLIWSEHCRECAEPACYATCKFYKPRPDRRCRRFDGGIIKRNPLTSFRGYGAEISFGRWSNLTTKGNSRMSNSRSVLLAERFFQAAAPVINSIGSAVGLLRQNDVRWHYVSTLFFTRLLRHLHRGSKTVKPDAFLLEIINPSESPVRMSFWMDVAKYDIKSSGTFTNDIPMFMRLLDLPAGYSRHVIPYAEFSNITESSLPFDLSLAPQGDETLTIVLLSSDFVKFRTPTTDQHANSRHSSPQIKCVVWDLDNTLWHGTLLNGDTLTPNDKVIAVVKELDRRGIINSVASKNNMNAAMPELERLGLSEYFLHPQIGWSPKSNSISTIADSLNIAPDTFAFVDDSAFERAEVTSRWPYILTIDPQNIETILEEPRFAGSTSEDARMRRHLYKQEKKRNLAKKDYTETYSSFLKSCNIKLQVSTLRDEDRERVEELVQRTNQLNFSSHKYSSQEISRLIEDPSLLKYVLKCSDNFGSYGTIGFALVRIDNNIIHIQDLMLSCRIQGKHIEQAFFQSLVNLHSNTFPFKSIEITFVQNDRNTPALNVLNTLGFTKSKSEPVYTLNVQSSKPICDWISTEMIT